MPYTFTKESQNPLMYSVKEAGAWIGRLRVKSDVIAFTPVDPLPTEQEPADVSKIVRAYRSLCTASTARLELKQAQSEFSLSKGVLLNEIGELQRKLASIRGGETCEIYEDVRKERDKAREMEIELSQKLSIVEAELRAHKKNLADRDNHIEIAYRIVSEGAEGEEDGTAPMWRARYVAEAIKEILPCINSAYRCLQGETEQKSTMLEKVKCIAKEIANFVSALNMVYRRLEEEDEIINDAHTSIPDMVATDRTGKLREIKESCKQLARSEKLIAEKRDIIAGLEKVVSMKNDKLAQVEDELEESYAEQVNISEQLEVAQVGRQSAEELASKLLEVAGVDCMSKVLAKLREPDPQAVLMDFLGELRHHKNPEASATTAKQLINYIATTQGASQAFGDAAT